MPLIRIDFTWQSLGITIIAVVLLVTFSIPAIRYVVRRLRNDVRLCFATGWGVMAAMALPTCALAMFLCYRAFFETVTTRGMIVSTLFLAFATFILIWSVRSMIYHLKRRGVALTDKEQRELEHKILGASIGMSGGG